MPDFLSIQSGLLLGIWILTLAIKGVALVDCIRRPASDIGLKSQLDKRTWQIILAIALVMHLVFANPLGALNILGLVAAAVYLAQVRSHVGS